MPQSNNNNNKKDVFNASSESLCMYVCFYVRLAHLDNRGRNSANFFVGVLRARAQLQRSPSMQGLVLLTKRIHTTH